MGYAVGSWDGGNFRAWCVGVFLKRDILINISLQVQSIAWVSLGKTCSRFLSRAL